MSCTELPENYLDPLLLERDGETWVHRLSPPFLEWALIQSKPVLLLTGAAGESKPDGRL